MPKSQVYKVNNICRPKFAIKTNKKLKKSQSLFHCILLDVSVYCETLVLKPNVHWHEGQSCQAGPELGDVDM